MSSINHYSYNQVRILLARLEGRTIFQEQLEKIKKDEIGLVWAYVKITCTTLLKIAYSIFKLMQHFAYEKNSLMMAHCVQWW